MTTPTPTPAEEPVHVPARITLPGHARDIDPAVYGTLLNGLPHALRHVVVAAVDAGAQVVVMHATTTDVYVSVHREPLGVDVDGPGLCVMTSHEDPARVRVEYAPRDYADATIRPRMAPDAAVSLVVGVLIGWGLMS